MLLTTSPTHPCQTTGTAIVTCFSTCVILHVETEFRNAALLLPCLDHASFLWRGRMTIFILNLWSNFVSLHLENFHQMYKTSETE